MTAESADSEWTGQWAVLDMECLICNHRQVSVYPVCCETLECGGCGYMNPVDYLKECLS